MDILKTPYNANKFVCEYCDFKCSKHSDWIRHIVRPKHLFRTNGYKPIQNDVIQTPKTQDDMFYCECGKGYKYTSGLWRHKNKCNKNIKPQTATETTTPQITPEMVITLIQQNKELQQTLVEQNKTIMILAQKASTTNSYNNNNNKTFNLQVFLNEQCKDAINITEFINSLVLSVQDLEDTSRLGYVEGISKIFINGLNQLDICKRPVHCSDLKRDIIYIKDEDQWSKDNETNDKITKAIKYIANKNIKQIVEWQKMNKDYLDPSSKQNDRYMKMLCEVMSGSTKDEQTRNYQKIIKNVSKEVVIDKEKI